MTKIQKIWFTIFLAMFIIPELLWSPVVNFVYELYKNTGFPVRNSILEKTENINLLSSVLFVQTLGLLLTAIYLLAVRKNIKNKIIFWMGFVLLFVSTILVFYLFGLSVSLRNIGF